MEAVVLNVSSLELLGLQMGSFSLDPVLWAGKIKSNPASFMLLKGGAQREWTHSGVVKGRGSALARPT